MSRLRRMVSWVAGTIVILAGAFLLIGSLQNFGDQRVRLEQARLESLARLWESRLQDTRLQFHDQMVRYGMLAVLDHPEDWSDWRIKNKFEAVQSTWSKENGNLFGLAIIGADGQLHSFAGDTSGLEYAAGVLLNSPNADMALVSRESDQPNVLALHYSPGSTDDNQSPAHVILLMDAASLLSSASEAPASWSLLSAPSRTMMASSTEKLQFSVSQATWPLFLSERSGVVPEQKGQTLCFVTLHIPGMEPLLLVESVPKTASATVLLLFGVLTLGAIVLLLSSIKRAPAAEIVVARPADETASAETSGFRQIFQTIADPLCVLDANGIVIRANRAAHDWLHMSKGKPDASLLAQFSYGEMSAQDLLLKAAEDPASVSGECRFVAGEASLRGDLSISRLSRDGDGHGPVLIHFHPQPERRTEDGRDYAPPESPSLRFAAEGHDSHCPFPVMSVTAGGVITGFNEAARKCCPRLEETPMLSDVLPGVESRDLPALLDSSSGTVFESLFGPSQHEFEIVRVDDHILLYGHRLSASKKLEVELKQAQENFYSLCSLNPAAILLIDPRDHAILEANAAAGDVFGFAPADLRSQILDSLTAEPWDFSAGEELFVAASTRGDSTRCMLRYELIKIEGMPTLLVVLEPIPQPLVSSEPEPQFEDETTSPQPVAATAPPPLPIGPGMLITMNPTVREVARRLLEKVGHNCEVFSSLDDATVWLITHDMRPELVAIDLTDFDEAEIWIEELRARCGDVPCIAITDGAEYVLPGDALNEFLVKPFDLESLTGSLAALNLEASVCESS